MERLDYLVTRPVLVVGPLAEAVLDKLVSDYPHKYARCEPRYTNWSQEDLEAAAGGGVGVGGGGVVDFRRRGSQCEYTTVQAIKEVCNRVSQEEGWGVGGKQEGEALSLSSMVHTHTP